MGCLVLTSSSSNLFSSLSTIYLAILCSIFFLLSLLTSRYCKTLDSMADNKVEEPQSQAVVTNISGDKTDETQDDNSNQQDSNPKVSDSNKKKNQNTGNIGNIGAPDGNQMVPKGLANDQTSNKINFDGKRSNRRYRRSNKKDNNDNLAESDDEEGEDFDLDFDLKERRASINLTKLEFENMVFRPYSKNWDEDETSSKRGMETGIDYNGTKFSSQKQLLDAFQAGLFGSNRWSLKIFNELSAALTSIITVRNEKSRRSTASNDDSEEKTTQSKRRKLYGTSVVCL